MTSFPENIPIIMNAVASVRPKKVLDVGSAFGKFGLLTREALLSIQAKEGDIVPSDNLQIDCVEITEYFKNLPYHKAIYNNHYHQNALALTIEFLKKYDLIFLIDVLEHWDKKDALNFIEKVELAKHPKLLISTPKHVTFYQEHYYGDDCPKHATQFDYKDFEKYTKQDLSNENSFIFLLFAEPPIISERVSTNSKRCGVIGSGILSAYRYLKSLVPWQIKAWIKGLISDVLYYRTAQFEHALSQLLGKGGAAREKKRPPSIKPEKRKINVLYLVPHLVIGGAETILLSLVKKIERSRFNTYIACCLSRGELASKFRPYTEDIFDLAAIRMTPWAKARIILDIVERARIDIVHLSNNELFYFVCPLIKLKSSTVLINWLHCDQAFFEKLHGRGYRRFGKFIDKTVVVNNYLENHLVQKLGFDHARVITIKNGVDTDIFNPEIFKYRAENIKDAYQIPINHHVIAFIARLTSEKNPLLFIRIAAELNKIYANTSFIIAGDGYYKPYMQTLARKLDIAHRVRFLGNVERIPEILSITSVLVSTSTSEGFGMSVAEAMAMRIPVVVTNVGGLKDLVVDGKNGYIIDRPTIQNFSNAIAKFITNEQRRQRAGEYARRRIIDDFNIIKTAKEFMYLYQESI